MSSNVYRSEVWKIENFSKSPDWGRVSPTFTPVPGLELNLELMFVPISPKGKKMRVTVSCREIPQNVNWVYGKITCSNSEAKLFHFEEDNFNLYKDKKKSIQTVFDQENVRLPSEIGQVLYLPDDVLIMEVSLAISGQKLDAVERKPKMDACKELAADFGEMYQSKCLADVKFTFVDGQVLTAHRQILSARSPVFRRMFESDMLEKNSDEVPIADFCADVFDLLLAFLYSGELADDVDFGSLCSLYSAADKYDVASLNKLCSRRMCSAVSVDNVGMILHLANLHGDDEGKQVAKDFIQKNL